MDIFWVGLQNDSFQQGNSLGGALQGFSVSGLGTPGIVEGDSLGVHSRSLGYVLGLAEILKHSLRYALDLAKILRILTPKLLREVGQSRDSQ